MAIGVTVSIGILLWPWLTYLIAKEKSVKQLLESHSITPSAKEIALREKVFFDLWASPPLCGQYIYADASLYREYGYANGTAVFSSREVAEFLKTQEISPVYGLMNHESGIARWVNQAVHTVAFCSAVPSEWYQWTHIERELIAAGIGECFCNGCQTAYPNSAMQLSPQPFRPGWNFDSVYCPEGHEVFQYQTIHFFVAR